MTEKYYIKMSILHNNVKDLDIFENTEKELETLM